jgi:hypothetical protein
VRRDDGLILVAAGPHEAAWKSAVGDGGFAQRRTGSGQ